MTGRYEVTVVGQGFQTAVVTAVEVPVGQSVRVDVELRVGAVEETAEDLRTRLAEAEDAEREAVREERDAQRVRDGTARRRDAVTRKAADVAARLADLDS